jgi:hypothetical protein
MSGKVIRTSVNRKALKDHLAFLKVSSPMAGKMLGLSESRFRECMNKNSSHKFNDDEIIRISLKFELDLVDFVEADATKMNALKRVIDLEKHFAKKVKVSDCREMKSPIEIVRANREKGKWNEKWAKLPEKEIDPRNHYATDKFGDKYLDYRFENGHAIVYGTGLSKVELDRKIEECHAFVIEKGLVND